MLQADPTWLLRNSHMAFASLDAKVRKFNTSTPMSRSPIGVRRPISGNTFDEIVLSGVPMATGTGDDKQFRVLVEQDMMVKSSG